MILRQPTPKPRLRGYRSDEGLVWETSATTIGSPPAGSVWVHVSDRGSDIFEYLRTGVDQGKDFLVLAKTHHEVSVDDPLLNGTSETNHVFDYIHIQPPAEDSDYRVTGAAKVGQSARTAEMVLAWAKVERVVPAHLSAQMKAIALKRPLKGRCRFISCGLMNLIPRPGWMGWNGSGSLVSRC